MTFDSEVLDALDSLVSGTAPDEALAALEDAADRRADRLDFAADMADACKANAERLRGQKEQVQRAIRAAETMHERWRQRIRYWMGDAGVTRMQGTRWVATIGRSGHQEVVISGPVPDEFQRVSVEMSLADYNRLKELAQADGEAGRIQIKTDPVPVNSWILEAYRDAPEAVNRFALIQPGTRLLVKRG